MAPEFTEEPAAARSDYPAAPDVEALMRRHGGGGRCEICQTTRCETWRDAHVGDIMSGFFQSPTIAAALDRQREVDRRAL